MKRRKSGNGQVMVEYAAMLGMVMGVLLVMMLLLGAFSYYGARIIGLVAWEPEPVSYDDMLSFSNGK